MNLTATIATINGMPLDGIQVDFVTAEPGMTVWAQTDAGGVLAVTLAPSTRYSMGMLSALQVDGVHYPAGTVLRFTTPVDPEPVEAEEPSPMAPLLLADLEVEIITANLPTLLARLDAVESRLAALEEEGV